MFHSINNNSGSSGCKSDIDSDSKIKSSNSSSKNNSNSNSNSNSYNNRKNKNKNNTTTTRRNNNNMRSLVRPRSSSTRSPPIRHARSLSPRSVMFEYEFEHESSEHGAAQLPPHLRQPNADAPAASAAVLSPWNPRHHLPSYEGYFTDDHSTATAAAAANPLLSPIASWPYPAIARKPTSSSSSSIVGSSASNNGNQSIGDSDRGTTRGNKRKLPSSGELPSGCRCLNLRHRKISDETVEWFASNSGNASIGSSGSNSSNNSIGSGSNLYYGSHHHHHTPGRETNYYGDTTTTTSTTIPMLPEHRSAPAVQAQVPQAPHPHPVAVEVEELWLGPVFESPGTVLAAIETLPPSVVRLDLDLRNMLHLLPRVLPLLFSRNHLKRLGLRVFGDTGAIEVARWIHKHPGLERLDLSGNRIGSLGARTLVDAIVARGSNNNSSNDNNNNNNNSIDRDSGWHLSNLNLSCNCILHGDLFGQLLALDTTLETLDLSYNWFGDEEISDLCRGLRTNTTLRTLNLYGCNRITSRGMEALLQCVVEHNTSLHEIRLQVHALDEEGTAVVAKLEYWLGLNRAGRCLVKESMPAYAYASSKTSSKASASMPTTSSPPKPSKGTATDDTDASTNSEDRRSRSDQQERKRERVPMGLWSRVLEKSKTHPDSIFYLVREGLDADAALCSSIDLIRFIRRGALQCVALNYAGSKPREWCRFGRPGFIQRVRCGYDAISIATPARSVPLDLLRRRLPRVVQRKLWAGTGAIANANGALHYTTLHSHPPCVHRIRNLPSNDASNEDKNYLQACTVDTDRIWEAPASNRPRFRP
eukprot:jgi/Psemu1/41432/gm1.41432_g